MNKTHYNKTISMKPIEKLEKEEEKVDKKDKKEFNLCFYVYQGKLTSIVEVFNHQLIKDSIKLVKESVTDKKRNPLQIAAFFISFNI